MKPRSEITEARLEAALLQSADIVSEFPWIRPIYDRLERELLDRRSKDPRVRARSLLRNNPQDTPNETRI